jgi:hypothetical protein
MPNDYISAAFEKWYNEAGVKRQLKDAFKAGWIECARTILLERNADLGQEVRGLAIGQGKYPIEDL